MTWGSYYYLNKQEDSYSGLYGPSVWAGLTNEIIPKHQPINYVLWATSGYFSEMEKKKEGNQIETHNKFKLEEKEIVSKLC